MHIRLVKAALNHILEVICILIIRVLGVNYSGILHLALRSFTYYYYRIFMGNTCKNDFSVAREDAGVTELTTKSKYGENT